MAPNSKINARRKARREPTRAKQPATTEANTLPSTIPLELQQTLLNIFRHSFADLLASDIEPLLQEVKGHLFNRDFGTAFGKNEYLEAYAARWSPSRALGYLHVFWDLREHLWAAKDTEIVSDEEKEAIKTRKVVCLGGGAGAEIVALAGLQTLLSAANEDARQDRMSMEILALDVADWTSTVDKLTNHIVIPPPLSKYASAAAQAANRALLSSEDISIRFHKQDIFTTFSTEHISPVQDANLITLMFTLNELYTTSITQTQQFLLGMTETVSPGTLLLIIDSPGSFSAVMLNGAEKKYPMQWLLDHTLLKQATGKDERGKDAMVKWEKIEEDESRWFRLDPSTTYPIALENMRMQLHLYRRL